MELCLTPCSYLEQKINTQRGYCRPLDTGCPRFQTHTHIHTCIYTWRYLYIQYYVDANIFVCTENIHTLCNKQIYTWQLVSIICSYIHIHMYIYIYWHESASNTPSCLTPFKHRPVLFVWWRYFIAQGSKSMGWRSAWPPLWMPSADAWRVKDFWAPRGIGSNGSLHRKIWSFNTWPLKDSKWKTWKINSKAVWKV